MRVGYRCYPPERASLNPTATYQQVGEAVFCCEEMRQEWGVLVAFGVKDCPRTTSRTVNVQTIHPQRSGSVIAGITPISHCPWCGQAIETCRVK